MALLLGARRGFPKAAIHPNNLVMTLIGAGILWVGWFGFNAGSTIGSGLDTARALTMTQISAATGAFVWMMVEAVEFKKATSLGFASGILAGLVVITPAAGVVQPGGAMILGTASSLLCYLALKAKVWLGYDDSLDCFGIHGVGSGLGVLLLSFFIRDSWMQNASSLAGTTWTMWNQLMIQALGIGVAILIAAAGTCIIYFIVEKTIGFRIDEQSEMEGMDQSLHGEHAYGFINSDLTV